MYREYILDLLESDRKLLVFAHHKEMLDAIEEAVKKARTSTQFINTNIYIYT